MKKWSMVFLLIVQGLCVFGQDPLKGLKKVRSDLRPIVGAYYSYTPPGPDWYYAKTSIPGPPEQRTEMFFRRDLKQDSLCLMDEVSIREYWVEKDHFLTDSTFHLWLSENIRFRISEDQVGPEFTMTKELRYGADMGYRMYMHTARLLNGLTYRTQIVCYVFRSKRHCMLPSLATGFVSQCRLVLIVHSREDLASSAPDLQEEDLFFELFTPTGSNPF